MADIFISYSKADRDKVVMLAAYLEAEGWTVWWDNSLAAGEIFRDEIMKQLAVARAVIVLWTQNSIKSDFVRAEAGRAKADNKLIPVKENDVAYGDIPLPFGEMHTEDLSRRELMRAAVVAQLAKPAVEPSVFWLATRTLRYQVLTWVGIVGGAITLFANLRGVLDLADWARSFVAHWQDWTMAAWQQAFSWIGVQIPKGWSPFLSFTTFCIMTAWGGRAYGLPPSHQRDAVRTLKAYAIGTAIFSVIFLALSMPAYLTLAELASRLEISFDPAIAWLASVVALASALLIIIHKEDKVQVVIFSCLFSAFYFIVVVSYAGDAVAYLNTLAHASINRTDHPDFIMALVFLPISLSLYVLPMIMTIICPLQAITRRLQFLAFGLAFLIGLNQLSLHTSDVRQWLKPPL